MFNFILTGAVEDEGAERGGWWLSKLALALLGRSRSIFRRGGRSERPEQLLAEPWRDALTVNRTAQEPSVFRAWEMR
jgi:hypothetical protein